MSPATPSIRETLSQRKRRLNAIFFACFLVFAATVALDPFFESGLALAGFTVLVPGFVARLLLDLRSRCPTCGGPWGRLLQAGPPLRIDDHLAFCPWCRSPLDGLPPPGAPERPGPPDLQEEASPVARLVISALPDESGLTMRQAFLRRAKGARRLGILLALVLTPFALIVGRWSRLGGLLAMIGVLLALTGPAQLLRLTLLCRTCHRSWARLIDRRSRVAPALRCCPWCGADPDAEPL